MDRDVSTLASLIDKMQGGTINESYEQLLVDVSKNDIKCFMETASIISEAAVSFSITQAAVLKSMAANPKVELWGLKNVPGWDKLNNIQRVNAIANALGQSGFHAARRLASNFENNGNLYELPDVKNPADMEQILRSQLGIELLELFINLLNAGRSDY